MSARSPSAPSSPLAGRTVLLGVTGGIAAYKSCSLARLFTDAGATVQVVMTPAATRFVGPDTFAALTGRPVFTDLFQEPGRVLHVELAHAADIAIVAPATANTLAKLALGFADDLLTSSFLEVTAPVVVAPAMHSGMYENTSTQENLRMLAERGVRIVGPATGQLAAGDEGLGRMSEPDEIFAEVEAAVARGLDFQGRHLVVSAGPTWEPVDAVRFVGNRSTGKMGFAVVREAVARGADVTLVLGPGTGEPPSGARLIRVMTAEEMREAILGAAAQADGVVMAAAVADYRPEHVADGKLKKDQGPPEIRLTENPDILRELGQRRSASSSTSTPVLVGFAAETDGLLQAGRSKLLDKGVDLVVVNEIGREGTGFGSDTNHAVIVSAAGEDGPIETWTKAGLARDILDRVAKLLAG